MPSPTKRSIAGAFLALQAGLVATAAAADRPCPAHLFVIARSKNANVVVYDARRDPAGHLAASDPVEAYWLLDGKEDRREELNLIERRRAYGFAVQPASDPGTWNFTFNAGGKRRPVIRMLGGCPVAILPIGGRDGILRRMFVESKEGLFQPTVVSVELFGEDLSTGAPLREKFVP